MKIAITGHTKGIGKALYDGFCSQGHEVLGFSRTTGYTVSTDEGIKQIVEASVDCDILIINAYAYSERDTLAGFSQITLLYEMFNRWVGLNKTIVIVGSMAAYETDSSLYTLHKTALELAAHRLRQINYFNPRLITLNPSVVDTYVLDDPKVPKMSPTDVFDILDMVLKHKVRISSIAFEA